MKLKYSSKLINKTIFSLFLILLIPPFIFVFFKTSSLAFGLLIASLLVIIVNLSFLHRVFFNKTILLVGFVFFTILLIQGGILFITEDVIKPVYSAPLLLIISGCMYFFSKKFVKLTGGETLHILMVVCYGLIVLGWISLIFPIHLNGYMDRTKPVFPFSEQSHYALAVGLIYSSITTSLTKKQSAFLFINLVLQAILFPNLTLLVFCCLAIIIYLSPRQLILLAVFIFSIGGYILLNNHISANLSLIDSYFFSRLDFYAVNNETTLVFFQGIDDAISAFRESNGLGLGFQMAGTNEVGKYGLLIKLMTNGSLLNREDGGFLASKIVSEFGIFGVFFLVLLLIQVVRSFIFVKRTLNAFDDKLIKLKIGHSSLIAISVEFFLRGYGYFSPTLCLFLILLNLVNFKK